MRTARHGATPPVRSPASIVISPERRTMRVADLNRRRSGLLFDLEQGRLALAPDNPWQERIALLQESLATIAADRSAIDHLPPEPSAPVPSLPVKDLIVSPDEPARVSFTVADEPFTFVEASDWDNRGGMIVRGDLRPVSGDPASIVIVSADNAPPADWLPVLDAALVAYAVSLRDLVLDGDKLPTAPSLRDIIREDAEVGGWITSHGTSTVRVRRAWQRQELRGEEERLVRELTREQEDRRTLIDRLPVARKRLSVLDDELQALGAEPDAIDPRFDPE